jgi:hypothetical protein
MTYHYDRTGERIDDDEATESSEPDPREWCDLLRQIAREARAQRDDS